MTGARERYGRNRFPRLGEGRIPLPSVQANPAPGAASRRVFCRRGLFCKDPPIHCKEERPVPARASVGVDQLQDDCLEWSRALSSCAGTACELAGTTEAGLLAAVRAGVLKCRVARDEFAPIVEITSTLGLS